MSRPPLDEGCAVRDPNSSHEIGRLKCRPDFLRVAKGRRVHSKAFTLQISAPRVTTRPNSLPNRASAHETMTACRHVTDIRATAHVGPDTDETPSPRIGYTLTRKVGSAVIRNRARRRLKEAVRLSEDLPAETTRDYVLIGRIEALRLPFDQLKRDLVRAFHNARETTSRPGRPRPQRTRPTA